MDRAIENNERFVVERRGEPAVVIMSVQDFIRTASPPPDWLEKAWNGAKRREEIDAETRRIDVRSASDPGCNRHQYHSVGHDLAFGQ